jgi:2-polyprenyl-3-methyl-5-hydroxy-6-metoxy-1,4-benzoquinol methylase
MRQIATARRCPWCEDRRARLIWVEAGYGYVRCSSCGGVFSNLSACEYARTRHNAWNDDLTSGATAAFYGAARGPAQDEFLERNPPVGNGRLLDVGCGLGFFLDRARRRGWEVQGVDTSPAWVEHANSLIGARLVQCTSVERASLAAGSFALVTVWDVIEHIFDPVPFLAHLRTLLAPGGRLFIRTPNIAYCYPVYAGRRWLLGHDVELGPTNHVVYFTAATMRDALGRAGLRASDWWVHVPPQVAPHQWADSRGEVGVIAAKDAYARVARALAWVSGGRLVLGSDLDVMCVADRIAAHPDDGPARVRRSRSEA